MATCSRLGEVGQRDVPEDACSLCPGVSRQSGAACPHEWPIALDTSCSWIQRASERAEKASGNLTASEREELRRGSGGRCLDVVLCCSACHRTPHGSQSGTQDRGNDGGEEKAADPRPMRLAMSFVHVWSSLRVHLCLCLSTRWDSIRFSNMRQFRTKSRSLRRVSEQRLLYSAVHAIVSHQQ